jgi:hypothetical protein
VGQHPRLARPRSGDDQQRPAGLGDRHPLLRVEPLQQRLGGVPADTGRRRRGLCRGGRWDLEEGVGLGQRSAPMGRVKEGQDR